MADITSGPRRSEKPVQARSIAMREKLIEAALEVIYDLGYNSASTPEFSRRAGVSRGALLHHFPTRSDIIIAAMEDLLGEGTREIRETASRVARQEVSLGDFVEFLWQMFSGRFFYISLEFINEARTDAELRERMIPVVRDFHAALDGIWGEFEKQADGLPQSTRVALNMTVCLVRGMGVQTVLKDDPDYFRSMLEAWKSILPQLLRSNQHDLGGDDRTEHGAWG
ncbi:TetR/AcrR family transcriptional regulator [Paracoccus saliphilus]|uniref:TetR/AcrR family transcriptional regulator n=1 Tax=Paracoccus saliphilus TaxID=405559 RepID=A0AA46A6R5_9RHOB|nr:TetR/AcrR family transcriptional regulator [Paracoccus saliphilus]WCR04376.1 TetR/AcrR family transcriptional regulator [Paracoccus saliphilus]SIT02162.1 transcriptional regulator, TetR family [Paracoccus saliphilus]